MTQGERSTLPKRSASAAGRQHPRSTTRPAARTGPADDERYRPGVRRTQGEPLAAPWRPVPSGQQTRAATRTRRHGLRGFVDTYGWRVYALPILVVLTVVVGLNTAGGSDSAAQTASGDRSAPVSAAQPSATPDATEQPVSPVDMKVPTADLPGGGVFSKTGTGNWHIVPGAGQRVGTGGKLTTYTVEVEDGVDSSGFGGDEAFARMVDQTLADPRGWTGSGNVSVQRVDANTQNPSVRISLTTPDTVHRPDMCGYAITYETSCYDRKDKRVVINVARWVRGAMAFNGDIGTYRQYAINHEFGHSLNNGHVGCPNTGDLAPVMMQQTFGVSDDYVAALNKAVHNSDPVAADGKICKPNAWPNPQAVAVPH